MTDLEKLIHRFRRTLLDASQTYIFTECTPSVKEAWRDRLPNVLDVDKLLIVSFSNDRCWTAIHCDEVIWADDNGLKHVQLAELDSAEISLAKNNELGFVPGAGLRWVTLKKKVGENLNIKLESGSVAEACLGAIKGLLQLRHN